MKLKKFFYFWHKGAKRLSLLLLSSIFLFGGYVHAQNVNMSRYITLNVAKDSLIEIALATDVDNTPVRIVSGDSVYNFTTTSTRLISGTYYAGANTMTIYGDVKTFYCNSNQTKITGIDVSKNVALTALQCNNNQLRSLDLSKNIALIFLDCGSNQLTSLDLSKNTALTRLYCASNQLTSLDVSKNTALTDLSCFSNQLTSLDVSQNTALTTLNCNRNQLTSLDVSQNTALTSLQCPDNQLTSLDVSKNTALIYLYCYRNNFSTKAYNDIMCSLPSRSSNENAQIRPLYDANDTNAIKFMATNATNATAKNWQVLYYYSGTTIPATTGTYECSNVNMNRYITLNVTKDSLISLQLATDSANTPIRIVSGDSVYNFTTTSTRLISGTYYAGANTMTIYGDVKSFDCSDNKTKITGIDVSQNTALTVLSCHSNQLTSLDVSSCTALISLQCYGNPFSTKAYNDIMCYLPSRSSNDKARFVPLSSANDANVATFVMANLNIATAKNWGVISANNDKIFTMGSATCNPNGGGSMEPVNMNRKITLNVAKDSLISIRLATDAANTSVRIVSGDSVYDFVTTSTSLISGTYYAGTHSMTIYGDVKSFDCSDNKTKITGIGLSNNTALCTLHCDNNSITMLNLFTNPALTELSCNGNQLTTLNLSRNTELSRLSCYGNFFTTKAYNDIMCYLPSRSSNDNARFVPLYDATETNAATFVAANASIATAKNWNVVYANANTNTSITTTGNDSCLSDGSGSSGPVNMSRYITLNVTKDSLISISLQTDVVSTPIRIVSGDSLYDFIVNTTSWTVYTIYRAGANTMTIYGDVRAFNCIDNKTKITGIDASNNTALCTLHCANNSITTLDVTKNTALHTLDCHNNQLTSLDVSGCTSLFYLYCYDNQLTSLDVSKNTALYTLSCYNNQLTTLNVNTTLINLYCYNNQLTTLDVSKNTALTILYCNNNQLTSLDVSSCTVLTILSCYGNSFSTKAYNDIMCSLPSKGNNIGVYFYPLYDSNDTNVAKFVSANASIATAKNWNVVCYFDNTSITTTGNDSCLSNGSGSSGPANMNRYITLNVTKDSLIYISLATDAANTPIRIVSGDSVYNFTTTSTSLISGTYYAGANTMTIYGDVKDFRCYDNKTKITGIDASKNIALCTLQCYNNSINILDVTKNTALTYLSCSSNQLTSLDVNGCTSLVYLYCYKNQLTTLDVSKNTALIYLSCYDNQLTSIDVSQNTALTHLYCYNNNLTSLDLSNTILLKWLQCNNNQLTTVYLRGCTNVTTLYCHNNQLTTVDLSGCTNVTTLSCYSNQLTSLDVSKNTALIELNCYDNPFTTAGYNDLMCFLPFVTSGTALFRPLYDVTDTNATIFAATNATNATAKNWRVTYYKGGTIPATTGNYDCSGVNMNRYITLNVTKDSSIFLQLATDSANTPVRIVSGDSVYTFTTTSTNVIFNTYYAADAIMTIYGDVSFIDCSDNKTKVTGIDASNNTALIELACYSNALTSLDVSGCTTLTFLYCDNNQLTSLDVSQNTALKELYCNNNALTSLDVSQNTALKELYCNNNALTTLDLSSCTALMDLQCGTNQLTSLDVSKNTALIYLYCYRNNFSTKAYNDIMCSLPSGSTIDNARFVPLYDATDANATKFVAANASIATAKNWGVVYNNAINTSITTTGAAICNPNGGGSIEPVNMNRYITLNVAKDSLIKISLATDTAKTPIKIVSGDSVYNFTASSTSLISGTYYAGANTMTIYGDVKIFYCNSNQTKITGIDASNNTTLTSLSCYNNALTSLDLSKNIALIELDCGTNQLTSLDVSKNTALTVLYCNANRLTSLDVRGCTALSDFECDNNQLTNLDVTKNTALIGLSCGINQLRSLDVSKNTALTHLNCYENQLTTLNVSGCSALTVLYCWKNQLTSLDVSSCTALNSLQCYGNPFTTKAYNDIMCSLPSGNNNAYFIPLNNANDTNAATFVAANASIATAKNWGVVYNNAINTSITTAGAAICNPNGGGSIEPVNMNRYITLNVAKDSLIFFQLATDTANTPIKIVNGDSTYNTWTGKKSYKAAADTMTIYGDVKTFYCYDNKTKVTGIDASNNTELTELICSNNQLTLLDVSKNTVLKLLDCRTNQLTSLDVSNNTALTNLYCDNNQLTSLDLSNNTALTTLFCSNNQLTSLDVTNNTALTYLRCYNNQLTTLDVSKNTVLKQLGCNNNQLTSLDLSNNTALTWLYCYRNPFTTAVYDYIMCSLPMRNSGDNAEILPLYDANDTNAIKFMATNANNATAKNWKVIYYSGGGDIPATSGTYTCSGGGTNPEDTTLIVNTSRYITLNVKQGEQINISLSADTNTTPIKIASGAWDTTITAGTNGTGFIYYPSNDTIMTIYGDVDAFYCDNNNTNITGINVSNNTALTYLSCSGNQLTSLDVSKNTALIELYCSGNQLTSLDVSKNTALTYLSCSGNQLTSLDVSKNTALKYLYCYSNPLTSLDVSKNTALIELYCYNNNLTSLNVIGCTSLVRLYCYENNLTTLDISACTSLELLECDGNNLTTLDVTKNTALTILSCGSNSLTTLDVRGCTSLGYLVCFGNKFSTTGYDSLMCSFIDYSGTWENNYFYPLYDTNDANSAIFLATNASNATAKNWQVLYLDNDSPITTNGIYTCSFGGEDPEDPTNVTEIKLSNIELYPNPTNSILNIKNATDNVQIFDITGRLIMNVENKGEALVEINVSNLAKGMYFVKVGNYTIKFVKE